MSDSLHVRIRRSDARTATVHAGRNSFAVGRALEFSDRAPIPSAAEYLLGAVGADVLLTFSALAEQRGLVVYDAEVSVSGDLNNPLVFLGVIGETGHPGYQSISATLFVRSDAGEEAIGEVWRETQERSPCANTLRRNVDVSLEVRVVL